ncbi:bifunctional uridylate/adenylate kinase [Sugiyamaella lignohabitans]|uniref:Uridylate kinase n=1 Tax=Sugiyamaella lignohabitans TaxID=796027 RepID=A0A167CX39_9ASCO|nr:bifunctional uridylate/adenylate kinase [Sugiyamaella lignohabitans]ANB12212.1 bifunctional uridylate/adenylate kinase [Sugiyamaella lignohabitans]
MFAAGRFAGLLGRSGARTARVSLFSRGLSGRGLSSSLLRQTRVAGQLGQLNSRVVSSKSWNSSVRMYSSGPQARQQAPKLRYFILIALIGTGAFLYTINKTEKKLPKTFITNEEYEAEKAKNKLKHKKTAFAGDDDVAVVFVLGGPGAGKGTQCANIVRDYGFAHLSAGDLLRAEQARPDSKYGQLIANYIKEGTIVPMEITLALLQQAMRERIAKDGVKRFLIDGFPRKMDQAIKFEEDVAVSKFVLFFECPEDVMLKRLLKRGESSGRTDDNIESIRKRFRTFIDTSMPVVDYFSKVGKVVSVSCNNAPDAVYAEVQAAFKERGILPSK